MVTGPSLLLALALLAARGLYKKRLAHRRATSGCSEFSRAVGRVSSATPRPPNGTRAVVREFTDVELSDAAK